MSAIYWEKNVDAQVYAPYILFYAPSTTAEQPDLGVWLAIPNTSQPIYWLDYVEVYYTGDVRSVWTGATAGAAVSGVIRSRRFFRFEFDRTFHRVN